jgi:UTP:GlnB (protein PII) uridylyltransferase
VASEALAGRDKIKKRERPFDVPTHITFDNEGSEIYTIIEVDTRDRPGLLYDLTKTLAAATSISPMPSSRPTARRSWMSSTSRTCSA